MGGCECGWLWVWLVVSVGGCGWVEVGSSVAFFKVTGGGTTLSLHLCVCVQVGGALPLPVSSKPAPQRV